MEEYVEESVYNSFEGAAYEKKLADSPVAFYNCLIKNCNVLISHCNFYIIICFSGWGKMEKKYKKRIFLSISLFIICISAVFIAVNVMSADDDIEYESFDTEHKTDITKKEDYKKAELERQLQNVIQEIIEGSDPLVSIHNFDVEDSSETTVDVTLYTDQGNEISEESQIAVEKMILESINGMSEDNISINIER